jgi:hypothetical protein
LFFVFFWPKIIQKKFGSNKFRLNSTRAFDWCINCHIWLRKNIPLFLLRVPPYVQNGPKFIFNQIWQFIHQSKDLVEFSRNVMFLNFFWMIFGLKNPKNKAKIRYFNDVLKFHVFGLKFVKSESFWSFKRLDKMKRKFFLFFLFRVDPVMTQKRKWVMTRTAVMTQVATGSTQNIKKIYFRLIGCSIRDVSIS